jgi:phage terminase large subunit GpA-like protein
MTTSLLTPESATALQEIRHLGWGLLAPRADLKVSEWADAYRYLPKGSSARPGPWRTESFQREMMDAVLERRRPEIVFLTCTQVIKSEALNNIAAFFIDADPRPILLVQPTDRTAMDYSKKRIAPMIAACPVLRQKVRATTSRQPGNTTLLKEFDGGFLKLAGANSAAGLRSDPIAVLLLDEIDGYPDDVDQEGDPIEIATRRTDSFDDAVIVKASTPGKPRGLSRIEREFLRSDQRRYQVPCPFCTHMQILYWRDPAGQHRLVWEKDGRGDPIPESVGYRCAGCGRLIPEKHKAAMLAGGRWVAGHPENQEVIGFHLNALYTPWRLNWLDLAREWTRAQNYPERLRAFMNSRLAETWDEGAEAGVEPHVLRGRALEPTGAGGLPAGICVLVATVDVQHNRLEAQITGFGVGEETWLVAHEIFWGNPGQEAASEAANVWGELDDFLLRTWPHPSGFDFTPALSLIDSGAHSDSVYDFVLPRQHARRVYACKGVEYLAKPGLVAESTTKKMNIRLFLVGTYAAKDRIFARLQIEQPGPGYLHLPAWVTDEYLEQLTGEKKIPLMNRRTRTTRRVYVKTHLHNEALDLTVYAHGALAVLQQFVAPQIYGDLARVKAALDERREPQSLVPARTRRMRTPAVYGTTSA